VLYRLQVTESRLWILRITSKIYQLFRVPEPSTSKNFAKVHTNFY